MILTPLPARRIGLPPCPESLGKPIVIDGLASLTLSKSGRYHRPAPDRGRSGHWRAEVR